MEVVPSAKTTMTCKSSRGNGNITNHNNVSMTATLRYCTDRHLSFGLFLLTTLVVSTTQAYSVDQANIQTEVQAMAYGKKNDLYSSLQTDGGNDDKIEYGYTINSLSEKPIGTVPPPVDGHDELCSNAKFDTIFNSANGVTYIFKGSKYWELIDGDIAPGYPKLISQGWPELPSDIDAAFTYINGKTYFFKGSKFWRYNGTTLDYGYPKSINETFPGIPDNIQAALPRSESEDIYFFKGDIYWCFVPSMNPPIRSFYPRLIRNNWSEIPDNLDDVFQYTDGYIHFFKDGSDYRYNLKRNTVVDTDRSTAYYWFGCRI